MTIYWLNSTEISEKDIYIYAHYLWTGDPFWTNIWFIWNEEYLSKERTAHQKLIDDWIVDSHGQIIEVFSYKNGEFFTKDFQKINWNPDNPSGVWKEIEDICGAHSLANIFLWESFFLPSRAGDDLPNRYGWAIFPKRRWGDGTEYYDRMDFYNKNSLIDLLENREEMISWLLLRAQFKIVVFYGDSWWKRDILEQRYPFKKWHDRMRIAYFNNNIIIIAPFLNWKDYETWLNDAEKSEIRSLIKSSKQFSIVNWLIVNGYDTGVACDYCKIGNIISNEKAFHKCSNPNCEGIYS